MKILKLPMIFICISVINIATVTANTPVKIAIISAPGKYKAEIDLLTAKLSSKKDLHVLDRVDIDYLLKEHAIAASDISKNSIKIGQLIGADGVIVISDVEVKGEKYAYLRFVGVKSGTILETYAYPLGVKSESLDCLAGVHRQFEPLFPRLNIPKKDMIPVSLLNFRSSSPSQAIINLERVVPKLLTMGLSADPKIVVTERWNAWQVAFEKELASDLSNFQTGSVLIDGSIEEKGDNIEIMARINKPGTVKKHEIKISDSKKEFPKLMRNLAASLRKYLSKNSNGDKWDTATEAKKFYEEAKWAYKFSKYQQAEDASDAAMTLGLDTFELAILRARILGGKYFLISDLDYRNTHYTIPFQYSDEKISNPKNHLYKVCKALDILSETRRKLLTPNYCDSWKTKDNFRKFDRIERNFLVFCPRLLIFSYMAKLHEDAKYADTMKMLQLKTRALFNAIRSRPSWENDRKEDLDNYKYQANMIFFATGVCWYNDVGDWLADFDKLLRDNPSGKEFYLIRRGLAEGRNRFSYCGKRWPFQLKGFEKEYYDIPIATAFKKLDEYASKLESSNDLRECFDGVIISDFSSQYNNGLKGHKIFQYIIKHIRTAKKGTPAFERCLIAAQMLYNRDFSLYINYYYVNPEFKQEIVSACIDLIKNMNLPPWEIINIFCDDNIIGKKITKQQCTSIIKAIEEYKKKHNLENIKLATNIRGRYRKYDKFTKKALPHKKQIIVKPLEINPSIKLADYDPKLKNIIIHTFKQSGNKLMLSGVCPRVNRLKKGTNGRYLRTCDRFFILIIDKKFKTHELVFMPFEIDEKALFPETLQGENFNDLRKEIANTLIFTNEKYHLVYINRFGDIFTYNKQTKKWRLHDSLNLNIVTGISPLNESCYISFGGQFNNTITGLKRPTGIIKYDITSKSKKVILNNQKLTKNSKIEAEHNYIVSEMIPLNDKLLYFLTTHLDGGKKRLHLYDADTNKITTFKPRESLMELTKNENYLLWAHSDDFFLNNPDFQSNINNDGNYYRQSLDNKATKWEKNLSSYRHSLYGIKYNLSGNVMTLGGEIRNSNGHIVLNEQFNTLHFWEKGKIKDKTIPVLLAPYHRPINDDNAIHMFQLDKNCLYLTGSIKRRCWNNPCEYAIWTINIDEAKKYLNKKLHYPWIFPYGWTYHSTEKKVSFWPKQEITMENLENGVEVRYSTDGSWPDEKSKLYTKPFVIDKSMKIIARAFKKGMHASDPFIVSYTKKKKNNP